MESGRIIKLFPLNKWPYGAEKDLVIDLNITKKAPLPELSIIKILKS
jgi:hypothetical protein